MAYPLCFSINSLHVAVKTGSRRSRAFPSTLSCRLGASNWRRGNCTATSSSTSAVLNSAFAETVAGVAATSSLFVTAVLRGDRARAAAYGPVTLRCQQWHPGRGGDDHLIGVSFSGHELAGSSGADRAGGAEHRRRVIASPAQRRATCAWSLTGNRPGWSPGNWPSCRPPGFPRRRTVT